MRTCTNGVMSATLAMMMVMAGCASSDSSAKAGAKSGAAADTKACMLQSGGRDVLRVSAPPDAECAHRDGMLYMTSHDRTIEIWLLDGAKTADEAVARVPQQIKDEFKGFKAGGTSAIVVAGAPARRMTGTGVEADDGDSGDADVIVFTVGGRFFVACTHGESLSSAAQEWMLATVQTAQTP